MIHENLRNLVSLKKKQNCLEKLRKRKIGKTGNGKCSYIKQNMQFK